MRPSVETKAPEPPLLNRTEAFCARSNQLVVHSNWYFSLRSWWGGSLINHMPSTARTVTSDWVTMMKIRSTPLPTIVFAFTMHYLVYKAGTRISKEVRCERVNLHFSQHYCCLMVF